VGKTFKHRNKWYDDNDSQDKKNKFNDRRKKKLRKIVKQGERLSDNADGSETDRDVYNTHI
jgi:hypothetical protein